MGKRFNRLVAVVLMALGLRACVLEPVRMTDESMTPFLFESDVALVNKMSYGVRVPGAGVMVLEWRAPQKGDLVVATGIGDPPVNVLRRITAMAGEKVILPDGKGATLDKDEFFLSAEQKVGAIDSRRFGPVSRKNIIGRATHLWFAKRPSTQTGSGVDTPKSAWRILQPL